MDNCYDSEKGTFRLRAGAILVRDGKVLMMLKMDSIMQ